MILQRPGKFRWQTEQPQEQLIIANNNIVWIYDKDLAQATKQKQQNDDRLSPALLLSTSNNKLLNNFIIETRSDYEFILKPRLDSNVLFTKLKLLFQQDKLQRMEMYDRLGQITRIYFTHIKVNDEVPNKLFEFIPPTGVDVVDNT